MNRDFMVSIILMVSSVALIAVVFSLGIISEKSTQKARQRQKEKTLGDLLNEFEHISKINNDFEKVNVTREVPLTDEDISGLDSQFLTSDTANSNEDASAVVGNPVIHDDVMHDDIIKQIYIMKHKISHRIEELSGKSVTDVHCLVSSGNIISSNFNRSYLQDIPCRINSILYDKSLKEIASGIKGVPGINYVYSLRKRSNIF